MNTGRESNFAKTITNKLSNDQATRLVDHITVDDSSSI